MIAKHEEVLVHFHAPWSKRCDVLRPNLRTVQQGADWGGRLVFAESDISDGRGYTTYLEHYGVTRLPALVLFRNGHPLLYPSEEPLGVENVDAWLHRSIQAEALPRGANNDAVAVKMLDAQAEADERIREMAKDASRQEEARRRERESAERAEQKAAEGSSAQAAAGGGAADGAAAGGGEGRALEEEAASSSEGTASCAGLGVGLSDTSFESVVMDKARDVFVLFYRKSAAFCAGNGTEYGHFAEQLTEAPSVIAQHMDVSVHKSPFVFEADELPVAMLFPAEDKRPLEFDLALTPEALMGFVREHGTTMRGKQQPATEPSKSEL